MVTLSGLVHQAPAFGEVDFDVLSHEQSRFETGQGPELICAVGPDGKQAVRFGLCAIRNLGESAADSMIAARREGGLFRSDDGGASWSTVTSPGVGAYAFEPTIAVDARGTVGMTWYDLRRDRPGDDQPRRPAIGPARVGGDLEVAL